MSAAPPASAPSLSGLREEIQCLELQFLPYKSRPFVCSGDPRRCQVFIVGENPATSVSKSWEFWRDESGFDRAAWLDEYERSRPVDKMKHSRTRIRIDYCIERLNPYKVLETNLIAIPTTKASAVPPGAPHAILDVLLNKIRPRVVLTHGKPAARWAGRLASGNGWLVTHIDLGLHLSRPISDSGLLDKLLKSAKDVFDGD